MAFVDISGQEERERRKQVLQGISNLVGGLQYGEKQKAQEAQLERQKRKDLFDEAKFAFDVAKATGQAPQLRPEVASLFGGPTRNELKTVVAQRDEVTPQMATVRTRLPEGQTELAAGPAAQIPVTPVTPEAIQAPQIQAAPQPMQAFGQPRNILESVAQSSRTKRKRELLDKGSLLATRGLGAQEISQATGMDLNESQKIVDSVNKKETRKLAREKEKDLREQIDKLRKEVSGLPESKRLSIVSSQFKKLFSAAKRGKPASDLAMVFAFMKILDPGSVVRESEFRTAEEARGALTRLENTENVRIPGWFGQYIQRIEGKGSLLPEQRKDFVKSASDFIQGDIDEYKRATAPQRSVIKSRKLPTEQIFPAGPQVPSQEEIEKINFRGGRPAGPVQPSGLSPEQRRAEIQQLKTLLGVE